MFRTKRGTKEQFNEAVVKTILHIRQYPRTYCFDEIKIPTKSTDKACLLGWIGYFSSLSGIIASVENYYKIDGLRFYESLRCREPWLDDPKLATEALLSILPTRIRRAIK